MDILVPPHVRGGRMPSGMGLCQYGMNVSKKNHLARTIQQVPKKGEKERRFPDVGCRHSWKTFWMQKFLWIFVRTHKELIKWFLLTRCINLGKEEVRLEHFSENKTSWCLTLGSVKIGSACWESMNYRMLWCEFDLKPNVNLVHDDIQKTQTAFKIGTGTWAECEFPKMQRINSTILK